MKTIMRITPFVLVLFLSGCASFFTFFKPVAVDKLYIPKQCPTFNHQFEIAGKKYSTNDVEATSVVMKLEDMTLSLSSNTKARETFNESIRESNKETLVKDISVDEPSERIVERVFVDRQCPKYMYTPEFKVRKLTNEFKPEEQTTYVVVSLENMVFQTEKHKQAKTTFNEVVDELNSKPFPYNLLPK